MTGPEAGTVFCIGQGTCAPVDGAYTNWDGGEPNNVAGPGGAPPPRDEDYAHMIGNTNLNESFWNDLDETGGQGDYVVQGYIVEYGGSAGDPALLLSGTVTVQVVPVAGGGGGGTKAEILDGSGVQGNGILSAPGLQKEFNPKSKAAGKAGKKG